MRPKSTHLLLLAVAAATLLTTGCRRGVVRTEEGLQTGRVSDRRLANLRRIASRDTGCLEARLEPRALDRGIYEVVGVGGCQVVRHYVMSCPNRWRCRWEAVPPIEEQAMADLGCAPEAMWVRATGDPMVRQVFACDVTAPYRLQCWARGCAWSQAGAPERAAPPADAMQVNGGPAASDGTAGDADADVEANADVEAAVEVEATVEAGPGDEDAEPEDAEPEDAEPGADAPADTTPPPPWAE